MDRSNDIRGLSRRRGCDMCDAKGLRCDNNRRPKCGHCAFFSTTCERKASIQSIRLFGRPTPEMSESNTNERRFETIEERLAAMENRISQQLPQIPGNKDQPIVLDDAVDDNPESSDTFNLPPELIVRELVDDFLEGFNQVMPIYDRKGCLDLIDDWYRTPGKFGRCTWGAINVILALALRYRPGGAKGRKDLALECIENAWSVLQYFLRDIDLKGLRSTLGLAILAIDTDKPVTAVVPIGMAVTLCRSMRIQLRPEKHLPSARTARLLWINYIVDRDLALRVKEPYLLRDDDIEIDYSDTLHPDEMGLIGGPDPCHIFKLRIKLAEIQGFAYDLISPLRGRKMTALERQKKTEEIDRRLRGLYAELPQAFRLTNAPILEPALRRHCIELHATYFRTFFASRGASLHNKVWMQRLKDYYFENGGKIDQEDESIGISDADRSIPLLPYNWTMLVQSARFCLPLFILVSNSDTALICKCMPALEASIAILCANTFTVLEPSKVNTIAQDRRVMLEITKNIETWFPKVTLSVHHHTYRLCLATFNLAARHYLRLLKGSLMPIKQEPHNE